MFDTLVVLVIVAAAAWYVVRRFVAVGRGRQGQGGGLRVWLFGEHWRVRLHGQGRSADRLPGERQAAVRPRVGLISPTTPLPGRTARRPCPPRRRGCGSP